MDGSIDSLNLALIISIIICILFSAYFSATETAFTSFNKLRIKSMAKAGDARAQQVLKLSDNYDSLLSTILIGNNIVNITSASLATVVFTAYLGDAGVSLSTVVMTVLVLIFGEISPKSLAKESPERFAIFSAPILCVLMRILSPLSFLFGQWKRLLSHLFKSKNDPSLSSDELLTLVEEAQEEGGIPKEEGELICSAIEFNDLDAKEVLTPRVDIVAFDRSTPMETIERRFASSGFSRLPVYEGTIDKIVGVVHEKDFHRAYAAKADSIEDILKPVLFTPPGAKISGLLRQLQKSSYHMAVVVDEFGGTLGLITLEDILEELVGEIWDEHDLQPEAAEDPAHQNLVSGSYPLDDFFERYCPGLSSQDYGVQTLNGFVLGQLGHIPKVGDSFTFGSLQLRVTKTDHRRALEIEVSSCPAAEKQGSAA